ncbi:MAG: hypothetical protein LWW77_08345 [Propionibacteriales bacterium]|nr:hypothetical protein [Propionibacteriales bacterium]
MSQPPADLPEPNPGMVPPPPPPLYPPPPPAQAAALAASVKMPRSALAARIIFFVGAGFAILMLVGAILMGASARELGYLVGSTLPGYLALIVAFGMGSRKRVWWVLALVVAALWILGGVGTFGRGDLRGVVQVMLPIAAVVLLAQPATLAYYPKKPKA